MDYITFQGKSVDDAITKACQYFVVTSDKLEYEIIDKGASGFFGVGAKPAVLRARVANKLQIDKKTEKENAVKLYRKCVERGLLTFESESDYQNLEIIARNYGAFARESAIELFNIGELEYRKADSERVLAERKAERESELKIMQTESRKAHIIGREKYTRKIQEQRRQSSQISEMSELAMRIASNNQNYQAKKTDWAIMGGAAHAIGGGALGLATALDVQEKNRQAEIEAEHIREKGKQLAIDANRTMWSAERDIQQADGLLETINDKLIDDTNIQDKFAKLSFSDIKLDISQKTGNVHVEGTINVLGPIEIVGSPASIDGSIQIDVVDRNGKCLGTGYYSAPGFDTIDTSRVGFGCTSRFSSLVWVEEGISLFDKELFVNITPLHIWYVEH